MFACWDSFTRSSYLEMFGKISFQKTVAEFIRKNRQCSKPKFTDTGHHTKTSHSKTSFRNKELLKNMNIFTAALLIDNYDGKFYIDPRNKLGKPETEFQYYIHLSRDYLKS